MDQRGGSGFTWLHIIWKFRSFFTTQVSQSWACSMYCGCSWNLTLKFYFKDAYHSSRREHLISGLIYLIPPRLLHVSRFCLGYGSLRRSITWSSGSASQKHSIPPELSLHSLHVKCTRDSIDFKYLNENLTVTLPISYRYRNGHVVARSTNRKTFCDGLFTQKNPRTPPKKSGKNPKKSEKKPKNPKKSEKPEKSKKKQENSF